MLVAYCSARRMVPVDEDTWVAAAAGSYAYTKNGHETLQEVADKLETQAKEPVKKTPVKKTPVKKAATRKVKNDTATSKRSTQPKAPRKARRSSQKSKE